MIKTKQVYCIHQDNGDGSHTVRVFDSSLMALNTINNDRIADDEVEFKSVAEMQAWMDDDPYENGAYSTSTITYEIHADRLFIVDEWTLSSD